MITWDKQFCSLALGLIVYDYYRAVATTYASCGGNATDDFLSSRGGGGSIGGGVDPGAEQ